MYTIQYVYQGCYVPNPGGNFEFGLYVSKNIPTTSVDDCASFSASQPTGNTLYFALDTDSNGDSVCTCSNVITSNDYKHVRVYFLYNSPGRLSRTPGDRIYCGGNFVDDPLGSVFAAI
ncbi:hypothetical protein M431DRAFT_508129 [Trichoderma harzianum CBS 226.95]|uniref:Uncharacterized protein n=1 Tax=Trichoderma harzianum CBS 226.95 TaxID=983964 RepID=A0A2T4ACB8_TRIHA|nr:hypothetical protein M431DRAFT_508129 [Trichoderma harzianum CBS 226.95]PTB54721.1 hypothetical protein M431DRAFT_508129 [Trichoderma harzianum CBS 226.95]